MADEQSGFNEVELATELTIAWLSNTSTRASRDEVAAFLARMHEAVMGLGKAESGTFENATSEFVPATTARRSLASKDHIISMIDGKAYKTLRRHLSTNGLTPEQYRERYNLKPDYPIVAPAYSEIRRAMAHKIGLGQKARTARAAKATSSEQGVKLAEPSARRERKRQDSGASKGQ